MRVSDGFRSFVLDQLDTLGNITPKDMFGGVGLYCRGVFFGILASDVLYLKVDETNKGDFEEAGSKPFTPFADRRGTMQYWAVPLDVLESAPALVEWAGKAVTVAERSVTKKRPTRKAASSKKTSARRR
jgi:DNA transformation protein and related proteins